MSIFIDQHHETGGESRATKLDALWGKGRAERLGWSGKAGRKRGEEERDGGVMITRGIFCRLFQGWDL